MYGEEAKVDGEEVHVAADKPPYGELLQANYISITFAQISNILVWVTVKHIIEVVRL